MAEYIEREAARPDAFCVGVSCQECPFLKDPIYGGCRVDDFIAAISAADVAPVRHGQWEFDADPYMFCSCCNYSVGADSALDFSYCPNCGARMDAEVTE